MTYPGDNEVVTFNYNNSMQPVSVSGTDTYAQTIAYDSAQRMIQLVRGANKVNTVFTYNPWNVDGGRLQNTTSTQVSNGTPLQNNTYDYDSVGNIQTITDSLSGPQTQTFTYDELDRLVSSAVTGGTDGLYTEGYSFESGTGNLKTKNGQTYTYDTTHKHAAVGAGSNTYGYDQNGNMTSRFVDGDSFTLNYDAENRLVSVTGASTANFYYDADGKQVKTVVDGVTTYYVGNHYEVKNSIVTKYYFAGTTRLAVRTNGTLSYLLGDHIGSSSVTTDADGAKTASALYKAFGETRYTLGNLGTDYKFTGQREEASLGIYFFNARWFDPSLGRFTSPDSIVPTSTQGTQAWDRYAFVNNNPVRYTDPTGHQTERDGSQSNPSDPCQRYGYDTPQCRDYLNLPEPSPDESDDSQSCLDDLLDCYMQGWDNFGSAWSIYWNPNATFYQRTLAGLYMGLWIDGHVLLAVGSGLLLREAIIGIITYFGTQNPNGVNAVIGGWPKYTDFSKLSSSTYFNLGKAYGFLDAIGLAKPANAQFMMNQISQGKTFLQVSAGGGGTAMEVNMIMSSGLYSTFGSVWSGFANIFVPSAIH